MVLADGEGVIREDEVYSKTEFERRTGLKKHAFSQAKRNGLRVIRTGGRVFVRGADWAAFLL